jgi:DNA-binding NarL/FixJ family response regulator
MFACRFEKRKPQTQAAWRGGRVVILNYSSRTSPPGRNCAELGLDLHERGNLKTPSNRVLVVEDFEPFRLFIRSTLRNRPEFQIIEEVSDGLEAVQKAEELQPDLILLDIGLPSLNGIDAARQIRKLSPNSKILFMSQESSADVVQEALALGALGYVVKVHAGSELLAALEAVLEGRQYVSSGLSGHDFIPASVSKTVDHSGEPLAAPALRKMEIIRSHKVEFYSDDSVFKVGFTRFVQAALESGTAVIVVVTESHRESIRQRLQENGVDIVAAIEQGRYVSLDVIETLSTFMVNDRPDPARFQTVVDNLVVTAAKATTGDSPRIAICGECAATLWEQGKVDAAFEVEHLCDEMAKRCNVDILCGFVLTSSRREQESDIYQKMCAKHSASSAVSG